MKRVRPGPGQESVWDYPRPPRLEPGARRVRVVLGRIEVIDTTAALRVLETSHPPTYYLPRSAFHDCSVIPSGRSTVCEFKGRATYWTLEAGGRVETDVAWSYPRPTPAFAWLADHLALYPGRVDACYVDGQRVEAQPGNFYGGWITPDVVGPFKGAAGTLGW